MTGVPATGATTTRTTKTVPPTTTTKPENNPEIKKLQEKINVFDNQIDSKINDPTAGADTIKNLTTGKNNATRERDRIYQELNPPQTSGSNTDVMG